MSIEDRAGTESEERSTILVCQHDAKALEEIKTKLAKISDKFGTAFHTYSVMCRGTLGERAVELNYNIRVADTMQSNLRASLLEVISDMLAVLHKKHVEINKIIIDAYCANITTSSMLSISPDLTIFIEFEHPHEINRPALTTATVKSFTKLSSKYCTQLMKVKAMQFTDLLTSVDENIFSYIIPQLKLGD